jgi:hypothetical protein
MHEVQKRMWREEFGFLAPFLDRVILFMALAAIVAIVFGWL